MQGRRERNKHRGRKEERKVERWRLTDQAGEGGVNANSLDNEANWRKGVWENASEGAG